MTYLLTNYQTLYYLCWSPYTPAYRSGLTCIGDEDGRAPINFEKKLCLCMF